MTFYLLYAKAKQEFKVAEEIRALDCEAICEPKIVFVRRGNDRRPRGEEKPYLPNYIFAEIPDDKYLQVMAIKGVSKRAPLVLSPADLASVRKFQHAARQEYRHAERIRGNREAICEYKPGQAVQMIDQQLGERMLTFRAMVERSYDLYPMLELEAEMFGRVATVYVDPLSVRAS